MVEIRELGPGDVAAVTAVPHLFDETPRREWTEGFLRREGNHLLFAYVDGEPAGFVSGVEVLHPDKEVEMMLYELGVDEAFRRRGVGRELVGALVEVARRLGCRTVWVLTEPDNDPALATYRAAGFTGVETTTLVEHPLAAS
jgi:ribosomal protein S18 acetylase RimI-like enzyme